MIVILTSPTDTMKNYFLPVCFAAAAHGALLFGFTKNPRALPPRPSEPSPIPTDIFSPPPDPPEVVVAESAQPNPKPLPDVPQPPRSEEPLAVHVDNQITMQPPPFTPVSAKDVSTLLGPPGVLGGDANKPWNDGVLGHLALDNPPRTRFQASPTYPFEAKRAGVRGEVQVEFMVNESGRVVDARIVSSSDRIFEEPTLRAVLRWQFEPGRRHGRIVAFRMTVPVVFNLND